MDTTKKIIDSVIYELSGFDIVDDSKLPAFQYFLDKLNHYRGVSLRELKDIPENMYTENCCLELLCDGQECTINGKTFKSKNKIHYVEIGALLDNVGWKNIRYFGLDGYRQNFTRKKLDAFINSGGDEYSLNIPYYSVLGDYAILGGFGENVPRVVCISALYFNPVQVCGSSLEKPYPCPDNILARAIRLVKMDALHSMGLSSDMIKDLVPGPVQPTKEENNGNA